MKQPLFLLLRTASRAYDKFLSKNPRRLLRERTQCKTQQAARLATVAAYGVPAESEVDFYTLEANIMLGIYAKCQALKQFSVDRSEGLATPAESEKDFENIESRIFYILYCERLYELFLEYP